MAVRLANGVRHLRRQGDAWCRTLDGLPGRLDPPVQLRDRLALGGLERTVVGNIGRDIAPLVAGIHPHMPGHIADAHHLTQPGAVAGHVARQHRRLAVQQIQDGARHRLALLHQLDGP